MDIVSLESDSENTHSSSSYLQFGTLELPVLSIFECPAVSMEAGLLVEKQLESQEKKKDTYM